MKEGHPVQTEQQPQGINTRISPDATQPEATFRNWLNRRRPTAAIVPRIWMIAIGSRGMSFANKPVRDIKKIAK
jgi:hypothetical protein